MKTEKMNIYRSESFEILQQQPPAEDTHPGSSETPKKKKTETAGYHHNPLTMSR